MHEQKYRYFIDGKEVDNRTDYLNTTMSGDYVSYFDGDSVFSVSFNSFFGENKDNNKMIKREVNGHLSDAINSRLQLSKKINEESLEKYKSLFKPIDQTQYNTLDLGQIKGSSTRHKSQNGETHKDLTIEEKLKIAEGLKKEALKQLTITLDDIKTQSSQSYYTSPEKKEEIKADWIDFIGCGIKRGKIIKYENSAEKTEKEENLVFQKDSEIHKEDTTVFVKDNSGFDYLKKRIKTTEAYKETEGKLFYELDWTFITQMAERMASNKKDSKYSLWNWKNPMTPKGIEDLKQATLRHLLEVLEGRYEDDGREFGHLEAISDNMMMINYQLKNNSK